MGINTISEHIDVATMMDQVNYEINSAPHGLRASVLKVSIDGNSSNQTIWHGAFKNHYINPEGKIIRDSEGLYAILNAVGTVVKNAGHNWLAISNVTNEDGKVVTPEVVKEKVIKIYDEVKSQIDTKDSLEEGL